MPFFPYACLNSSSFDTQSVPRTVEDFCHESLASWSRYFQEQGKCRTCALEFSRCWFASPRVSNRVSKCVVLSLSHLHTLCTSPPSLSRSLAISLLLLGGTRKFSAPRCCSHALSSSYVGPPGMASSLLGCHPNSAEVAKNGQAGWIGVDEVRKFRDWKSKLRGRDNN